MYLSNCLGLKSIEIKIQHWFTISAQLIFFFFVEIFEMVITKLSLPLKVCRVMHGSNPHESLAAVFSDAMPPLSYHERSLVLVSAKWALVWPPSHFLSAMWSDLTLFHGVSASCGLRRAALMTFDHQKKGNGRQSDWNKHSVNQRKLLLLCRLFLQAWRRNDRSFFETTVAFVSSMNRRELTLITMTAILLF